MLEAPQVFKAPVDKTQAILATGGGAAVMATADAILETVWWMDQEYWTGKFPFISFNSRLPPLDDFLLALIPASILAAGAYTMNPLLAYFGLGGTLYGGGILLKDLIQRNIGYLISALGLTSKQYADGAKRVSKALSTYA